MNKFTLSQLSLQKRCFDTKCWLNFQELSFSSRYRRPETRPDLTPETKFPLPRHLTCISIYSEWIPTPKAKVISLLQPLRILTHFSIDVGQHHSTSVLGYPTEGWRVEIGGVGYPSAPLSNCQPTLKPRCASLRGFTGRRIPGRPGVRFQCRQFVRVADSWG